MKSMSTTKLQLLNDGWLAGVRRCPSPNYNARPADAEIDLLVVHNISLPPGVFGGAYIEQLFTNQLELSAHPYFAQLENLRVSSHALIRRNGEIVQFVPMQERAWHAGRSQFQGRQECNDFSIGIELEGTDDFPYETLQYQQLALAIQGLREVYPKLSNARLVGHCDIAPGRKTDPGKAFDWARLLSLLSH